MNDKIEIEVLLCTFNGEDFLAEFLDSLIKQSGVTVHLRVSDDGSKDSTIEILNQYRDKFESFSLKAGPQNGPSDNFFSLIECATHDFIALADQDDIWMPNHLLMSVDRLLKIQNKPALSFCSVIEFSSEQKMAQTKWPKNINLKSEMALFYENQIRGCTIVLNKLAVEMINQNKFRVAIMHDWWIGLLIHLTGTVTYSNEPEILYRIHDKNYVGSQLHTLNRVKKFLHSRVDPNHVTPMAQLLNIYSSYGPYITKRRVRCVEFALSKSLSKGFFHRVSLLLTSHRLRNNILEEVLVRIGNIVTPMQTSLSFLLYRKLRIALIKIHHFIFHDFSVVINDIKNVKIKKLHLGFDVLKIAEEFATAKKIAIVAVYPRGHLQGSVLRLIENLVKADYEVLVVINESNLPDWEFVLQSLPISIIKRPNIGRDFGAYKIGWSFVSTVCQLESVEQVLFANDSVFYGSNFSQFVEMFEANAGSWVTAFLNFEKHTHAQSFFQRFSNEILTSVEFNRFWQDYFPSNRRVHAIDKGEVYLSQKLISEGFFPESVVTASSLEKSDRFRDVSFKDKYALLLDDYYRIIELPDEKQFEYFLQRLRRSFMESNTSHTVGLLANNILGAPLKLDIVSTGRATIGDVEETLLQGGLDMKELDKVKTDFLRMRAALMR